MRKIFIFMLFVGIIIPWTMAQEGLNVNQLFDGRFKKSPNAVEILVTGKKAQTIGLDKYHSLSISHEADVAAHIARLVMKDGSMAIDKDVEYRGGKLYYGFYVLPPLVKKDKKAEKRINRYLFLLNHQLSNVKPEERITLIYMEGSVSSNYVKQLIKK